MAGMSEGDQLTKLTDIFGVEAAPVIMKMMQGLTDGTLEEYQKLADGATGISKDMADVMLDTFQGQRTILGSAIESLMIDIGKVMLPVSKELVKSFSNWTSSLSGLAQKYQPVTKAIVGSLAAISAYKVGVTGLKIAWNVTKLPFQHARVAMDWLNAKLIAGGHASIFAAAKRKILTVAEKSWQMVMKAGRGLLNVGKIILYGAKSAIVATAKGAWTAAEWLWVTAMKAGQGLLNVGRLVLYGTKTIAVSIATKAWSITQGLLNFALKPFSGLLNIGKLALYYIKTIAVSVATKAWAVTQKLLNFAMKPFQGLLNVGRLVLYYAKTIAISVATKAWTAAQWLWNAAMNANPIGLLVVAIAGLVAAGYYLYKNWDSVSAWWTGMWGRLGEKASTAVEFVKSILSSIGGWASKYFKMDFSGMFDGLKSAVGSLWDTLSNLGSALKKLITLDFSGMWDSLLASGESIKGIFRGIGEAVRSLFNIDASRVIEGAKAVAKGIAEVFTGIGDVIKGLFTFDFSSIKDGFFSAISGWKDAIAGIGKTIAGLFNIDFSGTFDALLSVWETAKSTLSSGIESLLGLFDFSGVFDGLLSGFDSAFGYISDKFGELTSWIGGGLSSAWDWTKGLFGYGSDTPEAQKEQLQVQIKDVTVLNSMSEGFVERVAEMTKAWQPFKDSLGEGFENLYTLMQGVADKIRSVVIPAVQELASSLRQIATEITSIAQAANIEVKVEGTQASGAGGNIPAQYQRMAGGRNKGGYRAYAEGGIITKPHLGLVGEAGREAIIPLEKQGRGSALWLEAGRELGLISENTSTTTNNYSNAKLSALNAEQNNNVFSSILNALNFSQNKGSPSFIKSFTQSANNSYSGVNISDFGLSVAQLVSSEQSNMDILNNIGNEGANQFTNIMPSLLNTMNYQNSDTQNLLDDTTRGIPLGQAASQDFGASFGNTTTTNNNRTATISPNINITVNGGDSGIENRFRQIIEEVLLDLQDREARVSFA